jgi:hypothetical protein
VGMQVFRSGTKLRAAIMAHPNCYTSSSIGPAPGLEKNFLDREENVSIYWDDAILRHDPYRDMAFLRVVHQCEPPEVLNIIDDLIARKDCYDLILAWDDRILQCCDRTEFITESHCSWLDFKSGQITPLSAFQSNPTVANYTPCDVKLKEFCVSFLTSSKGFCPGHVLRQQIYEMLPENVGQLKVFKHRSPPWLPDKRSLLESMQFCITPENSRHNGYYSEKIVDCFVSKTIPIYWGCPTISKHFNPKGIIEFSNLDELQQRVKELTPETYLSRLDAVEENYHTALKGVHQWDLIENAISRAIERKKHQLKRGKYPWIKGGMQVNIKRPLTQETK